VLLALRRVRARLVGVFLDQRPSLLILRIRFPVLVRMIHRYYSAVRLLEDVCAGRTAAAFSRLPAAVFRRRHIRGLPVLVHEVSRRVWGLRLRRTAWGLALSSPVMLPSVYVYDVGVLIAGFRSSMPSPPMPLFMLHCASHGAQRKTQGRVNR
jgi:hypothetical protein